jgi:hypothetical protein
MRPEIYGTKGFKMPKQKKPDLFDLLPCPHCGAGSIIHSCFNEWWIDCEKNCQKASNNLLQGHTNWNRRTPHGQPTASKAAPG